MNDTAPISAETMLSALVAGGVDFHVSRIDNRHLGDEQDRRPVLRCRIASDPANLERAAVVLRQHGLPHATASRLRHRAWTYPTTAAGYAFVVTGRPVGRRGEFVDLRRTTRRNPDRGLDR